MPWAIPIGLAIGGMIDQNVQNKSAQAQNDQQQNNAINNARSAWQQASAQMAPWLAKNATPFANAQVTRPGTPGMAGFGAGPAGTIGGGSVGAASVAPSAPGTMPQNPVVGFPGGKQVAGQGMLQNAPGAAGAPGNGAQQMQALQMAMKMFGPQWVKAVMMGAMQPRVG